MKRFLLFFILISAYSTDICPVLVRIDQHRRMGCRNINAAVDLNVNLHNTINIPVSANPFKFGDTQWSHVVLQPGWRHWFVERYIGQFVSPSLFYANYTIGYDKRTFKGNAYGVGCSWGYSKLLSTRWNFIVEIGAGIVYTPYTEKLRPKYIGEFDDRVYLSSPPVPARPDQMQLVIFLLVLIHRSHDNDFRKYQRLQDSGIVCR